MSPFGAARYGLKRGVDNEATDGFRCEFCFFWSHILFGNIEVNAPVLPLHQQAPGALVFSGFAELTSFVVHFKTSLGPGRLEMFQWKTV